MVRELNHFPLSSLYPFHFRSGGWRGKGLALRPPAQGRDSTVSAALGRESGQRVDAPISKEEMGEGLFKTQKLVEQVVNVAIEHEIWVGDMEELVDWALAGHDPGEFYVKEPEDE
jgi:hypothetical protein